MDPSVYEGAHFVCGGTKFFVYGRKQAGIGMQRLAEAIELTWPRWISYFPVQTPPITVVETEWGLGGGSLGNFTVAIHLRGDYDEDSAKHLESILGWPAQSSGLAYIEHQFAGFQDPLQAYVNDQVAHELGHIFFLHGIGDVKQDAELWFGLGLGLVYDRQIWSEIAGAPSPVFVAFDRVWREKFSKNPQIDQRLINPDTKQDEKFGLIRLQTYGHAKALAYLTELRARIGAQRFDAYVKSYLARPLGSAIAYEDFLSLFSQPDLDTVRQLETEFSVR
jgi:hypothetical protein